MAPTTTLVWRQDEEILSVRLANSVELTTGDIDEVLHGSDAAISPAIFFADVAYADGASETYQIPLAASRGDDAGRIATDYPRSVILSATAADEPAILTMPRSSRVFARECWL